MISPDHDRVSGPYLEKLRREIELVGERVGRRRTLQLHLGGGTPTYHTPEELDALLSFIADRFSIEPNAELSVEVDPRVTSTDHLDALRGAGFNRISLGVQDFDPRVQETIGRVQSIAETAELVDYARRIGFVSVNFDLVYGLPHQTPDRLGETMREVVALEPDRLAVYSFAYLPTMRGHQRKLPTDAMPRGPEKFDLLTVVRDSLLASGYADIGIDHFALRDDELAIAQAEGRLSRNFMGYSVLPADHMIAFGVSSIGNVADAYAQNTKKLSRYYAALDAGTLPTERGCSLDADDVIRAHVIRELMCNFVVDKRDVERRFGIGFDRYFAGSLEKLAVFESDELVDNGPDRLAATERGRALARNLAMCFDRYRESDDANSVFSRTV